MKNTWSSRVLDQDYFEQCYCKVKLHVCSYNEQFLHMNRINSMYLHLCITLVIRMKLFLYNTSVLKHPAKVNLLV